jgi:hypothetical protein
LAVADEVTCLSIIGSVRELEESAMLVFPLATALSVQSQKTELPEFMLSIMVNRDPADDPIFDYLRDALWQMLQTDVELLAGRRASGPSTHFGYNRGLSTFMSINTYLGNRF